METQENVGATHRNPLKRKGQVVGSTGRGLSVADNVLKVFEDPRPAKKAKLQVSQEPSDPALKEKLQLLTDENSRLKSQINENEDTKSSRLQNLEKDNITLKNELKRVEKENTALKNDVAGLKQKCVDNDNYTVSLKKALGEAIQDNEQMEKQLEEMKSTIEKAQRLENELSEYVLLYETAKSDIESLQNELNLEKSKRADIENLILDEEKAMMPQLDQSKQTPATEEISGNLLKEARSEISRVVKERDQALFAHQMLLQQVVEIKDSFMKEKEQVKENVRNSWLRKMEEDLGSVRAALQSNLSRSSTVNTSLKSTINRLQSEILNTYSPENVPSNLS